MRFSRIPILNEPDISAHHTTWLKKSDWDAVEKAMAELYPDYYKALPEIMKERYIYVCNLVIAKGRVLADYCQWLFYILERAEEISNPAGERNDRYIGVLSESLLTVYFRKNADRLKIAHTDFRELE